MKLSFAFVAAMLCLAVTSCTFSRSTSSDFGLKPRVVVLTDIAPGDIEPDDMESMIRLMAHADLFEIEALITSGGWNSSGRAYPVGWKDSLSRTINAYEKDLPNLMKRSSQEGFMSVEDELRTQEIGYWPSADYMRSRAMLGSLELGRHMIGEDNRSEGSDHIVSLADEDDDRPIWILAWGGANTFAQAIWQVQQERTPEQVKDFLRKFRVYTITDQDVPYGDRHSNYPFSSHYEMRRDLSEDLCKISDIGHAIRYIDIGQTATSFKRAVFDISHTIRYFDTGHTITHKCITSDTDHFHSINCFWNYNLFYVFH